MPDLRRLGPSLLGPTPLEVWSVAPGRAQIMWGALPTGPVRVDDRMGLVDPVVLDHPGGPGGVVVEWDRDEMPDHLRLRHPGLGTDIELEIGTSAAAVGARRSTDEPIHRIATISDLHLGAGRFGLTDVMTETGHRRTAHPTRCADAAVEEALAWGADLVVIKGDAAHHRGVAFYDELGRFVDRHAGVDMVLVAGNHDVDHKGDGTERPDTVGERELRYHDVHHVDLPGVRLVVGDTAVPAQSPGTLAEVGDELIERAADGDGRVIVMLHHHLDRFRLPLSWPPGIPGTEANPWLDRLDAAAPGAVVTSGHCHRNRTRTHGSVRVSEVGSTKDFPGVWAGYEIHDDGIRQFVQRIHRADTIGWHERGRMAAGGVWGWFAPGDLDDRCWFHEWA